LAVGDAVPVDVAGGATGARADGVAVVVDVGHAVAVQVDAAADVGALEAVTVDVAGSGARSHHAAAAASRAARAETATEARTAGPTGADAAAQARGAHGTGRTDCVGATHRAGVHHAAACTGRARGTCGTAAASAHHHRRHHAALVALALAALRVRVDGGLAELTVVEAVVAVRRHAGHRTLGGTALHLGRGILGIS